VHGRRAKTLTAPGPVPGLLPCSSPSWQPSIFAPTSGMRHKLERRGWSRCAAKEGEEGGGVKVRRAVRDSAESWRAVAQIAIRWLRSDECVALLARVGQTVAWHHLTCKEQHTPFPQHPPGGPPARRWVGSTCAC